MANLFERDKRKRYCYLSLLSKRENLKRILKDREQNIDNKYEYQLKLNRLAKDSSKVRLSNRCIITGRTHSVLRIFRMARIKIKELTTIGFINGLKKSSW
jgi:small subunit ribosomal protein S14